MCAYKKYWLDLVYDYVYAYYIEMLYNILKGAQAWDIQELFFYTNQTLMVRWLGDWQKNWNFESWSHYFLRFLPPISY